MNKIVRISAALALGSVAVTGCSSESGRGGGTSSAAVSPVASSTSASTGSTSSSTSSAAPSATGVAMPEAAKAHTDAGAIAFAKFYLQLLNDSYKSPTRAQLAEYSDPTCKSCNGYIATAKDLSARGLHYSSDPITYTSASIPPGAEAKVIKLEIVQNPAKIRTKTGRVYKTVQRADGNLYFTLKSLNGRWLVQEVQV